MPNPAVPASSPTLPATATEPSPSRVVALTPPPRYQVRPVLWANRKRFVVRDTETDTTIAIRTTSKIADSDLIRLNMGVHPDVNRQRRPLEREPHSVRDDAPGPEPVITATERQCGRCRGVFPLDPTLDPTMLQDWWLCGPCRNKLLGGRRGTDPS